MIHLACSIRIHSSRQPDSISLFLSRFNKCIRSNLPSMRASLRFLFHRSHSFLARWHTSSPPRSFSTTIKMSSASTAVALYASVITASKTASQPEDAAEKSHHAKGGGFINPWDSFFNRTGWEIVKALFLYGFTQRNQRLRRIFRN